VFQKFTPIKLSATKLADLLMRIRELRSLIVKRLESFLGLNLSLIHQQSFQQAKEKLQKFCRIY
jgi:hypothetical protein